MRDSYGMDTPEECQQKEEMVAGSKTKKGRSWMYSNNCVAKPMVCRNLQEK